MGVKVVKFGGSSLADANQFRKVANIIKSDDNRRFVVPSAPGKRFSDDIKITDMLYACYDLASKKQDFSQKFNVVKDRYNGIIADLGLDLSLDEEFEEIERSLKARAGRDYAASRGEYLNGIVLAKYLGFNFIDAGEVIFFDEKGNFMLEKTVKAIRERVNGLDNAVIPGFYGITLNDTIKTFSRGGSDVTGSIVANAVKADLYENWTDVSGFLIADPRIVENPEVIKVITYNELRELSYMGATVLHEDAIFPVRNAGIPINIRNTNEPEDEGTLIVKNETKHENTITGVAGKQNFTVLSIEKSMMNSELGFCRKVLTVLEHHGVSFENMPSGIDTVSVVISDSNLKNKTEIIVEEIKRSCNPDSVVVYPNMALIATVGTGMAYSKGVAARIFNALAEADINIRMIDQGSSEINVLVGIENDDFEKGINAIYKAFN